MKYCSHCGTNLKKLEEYRRIEEENRATMRRILTREDMTDSMLTQFATIKDNFYELHRNHAVLVERMRILEDAVTPNSQLKDDQS